MKTVMMLGGSSRHVPFAQALKRAKYSIICVDRDFHAPAQQYADIFIPVSIKDTDNILDYATYYNIDACISVPDIGLKTCSVVNSELGLKGINSKTYNICRDKVNTKMLLSRNDINVPALSDVEFPVIVKPIYSTGSQGVMKLNSIEALQRYVQWHDESPFIIETFIEGDHVSVDLFMQDGKLVYYLIQDRFLLTDCFVDNVIISPSVHANTSVEGILVGNAIRAAGLVGIEDGAANVQYIVQDNVPYLIEINPRISGPYGLECHSYATGIDWFLTLANIYLGKKIKHKSFSITPNSCVTIGADRCGVLYGEIIPPNKYTHKIWYWKEVGDTVSRFNSVKDSICHIFMKGGDYGTLLGISKSLVEDAKISVRSE